jgi:hypothetical protein
VPFGSDFTSLKRYCFFFIEEEILLRSAVLIVQMTAKDRSQLNAAKHPQPASSTVGATEHVVQVLQFSTPLFQQRKK